MYSFCVPRLSFIKYLDDLLKAPFELDHALLFVSKFLDNLLVEEQIVVFRILYENDERIQEFSISIARVFMLLHY